MTDLKVPRLLSPFLRELEAQGVDWRAVIREEAKSIAAALPDEGDPAVCLMALASVLAAFMAGVDAHNRRALLAQLAIYAEAFAERLECKRPCEPLH